MKRILPIVLLVSSLFGQDKSLLQSAFESAGSEFNVPSDVLKGIAFAETRWQQLEWAPGDTASCAGLPRVYGVMALRDDGWFGHSLQSAARLTGMDPDVLKKDPVQNIRGAAAFLRSLYDQLPVPNGTQRGSLESWQNAIAVYCGIPQQELAQQHALEIFERVSKGYNEFGIRMIPRNVNLAPLHQSMEKAWSEARLKLSKLGKTAAQPDYPDARFISAYPGTGAGDQHWYTSGYARDFMVIHDMEGYYLSVISYFQQAATQASVHYCINGLQDNAGDRPAGDITQMVEEQYWAWHVICWNRYSLGIEHEGFVSNPAWFSVEQYLASAKLTRYACLKYGIPMDRNHIIGHNQWQSAAWQSWVNTVYKTSYPAFDPTCNTHTDPGAYWDWDFYMQMVKRDSTAAHVVSKPPTDSLQAFQGVSISFDQRMDQNALQQALMIQPATSGTITWSLDYRTMTFTPSTQWVFDTTYTVSLDTTAKNYLGIGLDIDSNGVAGDYYSFQFRTVVRDTIPPAISAVYPQNNAAGISTSAEFQIEYNEPMAGASIPGSAVLTTQTGDTLALTSFTTSDLNGGTFVRIKPATDLSPMSGYKLTVLPSAKDFGGNTIPTPLSSSFNTGPAVAFNGTVIDGLNAVGGWWQPSASGSTVGVQETSFQIVTDRIKGGTGSGKVTYSFANNSGGNVREHNSSTPSIEGGTYVGAWVYGDNSGNQLEYWFYYSSTYIIVSVAPINWTGWKLELISTSQVPAGTGRRFASFGIRQVTGARKTGVVYFDELTVGSSITGNAEETAQLPAGFGLDQNFPNPFNPSTTITYRVSSPSPVKIGVYDVLGRVVDRLVQDDRPAGIYRVIWNASAFPSGIYYVRMEATGFTATRKIVLLK